MIKHVIHLLLFFILVENAQAQEVKISIVSPPRLEGRKAILLTREKGFAAIVHSIKLGFDTTHLQMDPNLVPELYQLQVSRLKGSLTFFFEPGTRIFLDTADVGKSVVTGSESNLEWIQYRDNIENPSDKNWTILQNGENKARKANMTDSLSYWLNQQAIEKKNLLEQIAGFITTHPRSYVSLYLLRVNWYAFKDKGLFEKLDPSVAHHRSYQFLRNKNRETAKTNRL